MQVLNTTSPLAAAKGAPNRTPSKQAPDSRTSRPGVSDMCGLFRGQLQSGRVLVGDVSPGDRQQHLAAQALAGPPRVARARGARLCADDPPRLRIEPDGI